MIPQHRKRKSAPCMDPPTPTERLSINSLSDSPHPHGTASFPPSPSQAQGTHASMFSMRSSPSSSEPSRATPDEASSSSA